MKNLFLSTLSLVVFTLLAFNTQAQTTSKQEAEVKELWTEVNKAYDSGDTEKMWAYYTEDAVEIGPDGSLTTGKKALRESWEGFMKMVDSAPKFTYTNVSVRVITSDVALLTWDSNADIKIKGQQVGGPTRGMAVVHKVKGKWLVEFDSLTPMLTALPGQ